MVRVITLPCSNCGTTVADNVLENHREMKCPRLNCDEVLRFSDLPEDEQQHIIEHPEQYLMED